MLFFFFNEEETTIFGTTHFEFAFPARVLLERPFNKRHTHTHTQPITNDSSTEPNTNGLDGSASLSSHRHTSSADPSSL